MNHLMRLMVILIVVAITGCSTSRTETASDTEGEFKWEQYGDCKYFYKRQDERVTAMFTSCALPYDRAKVVDAMHSVISHAYGDKVFSEPYSKDNQICITGREHVFCATPGGNGKGEIISLTIDRTSPL